MNVIRCFIALTIAHDTQLQIADIQNALKKNGARARWVKPGNIHITLRFLGNRSLKKVKAIAAAMPTMVTQSPKINFHIDTIGAFPDDNHPRVIWAGASQKSDSITKYFKTVNNGLAKLGIPKERSEFIPHLTIARCKTPDEMRTTAMAIQKAPVKLIEAKITHITFYQSTLDAAGAIYTPIAVIA